MFLDLPFGDIEWTANIEFRSPYSAGGPSGGPRGRMSSSRTGLRTEMKVVARSIDIVVTPHVDSSSSIVLDDTTAPHAGLSCVIVGRLKSESGTPAQKHWVLLVRELSLGLYERVGAGVLPKSMISQGPRQMDASVC